MTYLKMESLQVRGGAHMRTGILREPPKKKRDVSRAASDGGPCVFSGGGTPPVRRWVGPLQDPRHA